MTRSGPAGRFLREGAAGSAPVPAGPARRKRTWRIARGAMVAHWARGCMGVSEKWNARPVCQAVLPRRVPLQHGQHRGHIGHHATPDAKTLGGLPHQHTQTIAVLRHAGSGGLLQKGCRVFGVDAVVGQTAAGKQRGIQGRTVTMQAGGGGVDQHVGRGRIGQRHGFDAAGWRLLRIDALLSCHTC